MPIENNPVNDPVRVNLHSRTFVLPEEEAAFQEGLTCQGMTLIEGMRTGAVRPCDGHRPWLTHPDQKPELPEIALGRYQVDVTLFTTEDLRRLAEHTLRELSHVAKEMKGYHPIPAEFYQICTEFSKEMKKKTDGMILGRSISGGLTDMELEGAEVYKLIEKPSSMKESGEEASEAVLVTNWNQGFLLFRSVSIDITKNIKVAIIRIEHRKIAIEDAVKYIVDWRDFVRFINRLRDLFQITDSHYKLLLAQIGRQSIHTLTANLIHDDPDKV